MKVTGEDKVVTIARAPHEDESETAEVENSEENVEENTETSDEVQE